MASNQEKPSDFDVPRSVSPLIDQKRPGKEYSDAEAGTTAKDRRQRDKGGKWQEALLFGLVAINVALLVLLFVFTLQWKHQRDEAMKPTEQTMCVPRADLPAGMTNGTATNQTTFCASASNVLDGLVQKYTEKRFNEDLSLKPLVVSPDCKGGESVLVKPAARVAGVTAMVQDGLTPHHLLHWNKDSPLSFMKNGVDYQSGHLLVEKPGFYYVYSQVKFNDNATSASGHAHMPVLSHHVFRRTSGSDVEEKLLESSQSRCQVVSSRNATSYIGAVFQFAERDKVYVKVSHRDSVAHCTHSNFFGIHMI